MRLVDAMRPAGRSAGGVVCPVPHWRHRRELRTTSAACCLEHQQSAAYILQTTALSVSGYCMEPKHTKRMAPLVTQNADPLVRWATGVRVRTVRAMCPRNGPEMGSSGEWETHTRGPSRPPLSPSPTLTPAAASAPAAPTRRPRPAARAVLCSRIRTLRAAEAL